MKKSMVSLLLLASFCIPSYALSPDGRTFKLFCESIGGILSSDHVVANMQSLSRAAGYDIAVSFWVDSNKTKVIGEPQLLHSSNQKMFNLLKESLILKTKLDICVGIAVPDRTRAILGINEL